MVGQNRIHSNRRSPYNISVIVVIEVLNPCTLAKIMVLLYLLPAAILDWRFREIDPEYWYPGLIVSFPLGLACASIVFPLKVSLALYGFSGLIVLVMIILYLYGMLGGADVFASLLILFALPVPEGIGLPPLISIMLYSSLLAVPYRIIVVWRATGKPGLLPVTVRRSSLLEDPRFRWWIPRGADIEDEWSLTVIKKKKVVASPGAPQVSLMFVGFIIHLIVGDIFHLLLTIK
jgi:hypothetical protein